MTLDEAIAQIKSLLDYFKDRIEKETNIAFDKDEAKKDAEALKMGIEALEQLKWIPIDEKMPKEGEEVLVSYRSQDEIRRLVSRWFDVPEIGVIWTFLLKKKPIAWMPLPKPYTPYKAEKWINFAEDLKDVFGNEVEE